MYKSYVCIKEKEIDNIENNVIELKTNYFNFKKEIQEIKETQKLIVKLIITGLTGLFIEIVGLLIGLLIKFIG